MSFFQAITVRGRLVHLGLLCALISIVVGVVGLWETVNANDHPNVIVAVMVVVAVAAVDAVVLLRFRPPLQKTSLKKQDLSRDALLAALAPFSLPRNDV